LSKRFLAASVRSRNDVEGLDSVAAELRFGLFDIRHVISSPCRLVREVEHHAVAVAILDGNAFGARRRRIDVPPRVDVRADVIAGDDHAVIGDLIHPELVGADALRHLAVGFHFDDDRLGDVGIGHHPWKTSILKSISRVM
jgi:hypothetical protein